MRLRNGKVLREYKPSRAILRGTHLLEGLIKRIGGKDLLFKLFDELDLLWSAGQFAPTPEPQIKSMFPEAHLTSTEVLHLILAWQEARCIKDLDARK